MTQKVTLFIPDTVNIILLDKNDQPLHRAGVLLGIQTHANYRNDIDISPIVSDRSGLITITRNEIMNLADEFISYGIMDYSRLEGAKPNIAVYFRGKRNINIFLGYEVQPELIESLKKSIPNFDLEHYKRHIMEQAKRDKNYSVFENSFNRSTDIVEDKMGGGGGGGEPRK